MASTFATKLAALAETEFNTYNGVHETQPKMAARIKKYWTGIGLPFPGVGVAWSAVFVSFFVKTAGASAAEFKFSARHSEFVFEAIKNFTNGTGVFRGQDVKNYAPKIGDIIQNNRTPATSRIRQSSLRKARTVSAATSERSAAMSPTPSMTRLCASSRMD